MYKFALSERQLLDAAPDAMVVVNSSGKIVLVNCQTETLFEYSREELIGKRIEILLPERYRHTHPEYRKKYIKNPKMRPMGVGLELFGQRKNGSEFPIEISLSPVKSTEGLFIVSAIRNVTSHKETERVLQNAREIAEAATATKSRFLAAASHDLRQPLQSLGLYLSVIERRFNDPKLHDVSRKMRTSLETISEILDALLDISKLDAGNITPVKRDFAIQDVLDRILEANMPQADEKGLRLERTESACIVYTDPALIERVIENFVTNAIRYTEKGQITIGCQLENDFARISVSDTGLGIARDNLDKIFEEYFQLGNPVRDRRKGLGLGLSIVKYIARMLGHPLEVISEPGAGSTFSIKVPIGKIRNVSKNQSVKTSNTIKNYRTRNVMVVDDDSAIIDSMTMLLESSGFKVYSAHNGDDAIMQIKSGAIPHVLISDYRLPGYSGIELIRHIRQLLAHDIPAILITGDTSLLQDEMVDQLDCAILYKPIDATNLLDWIDTYGE